MSLVSLRSLLSFENGPSIPPVGAAHPAAQHPEEHPSSPGAGACREITA